MGGIKAPVTLKLKVNNRTSGLLEWRPCECSITSDAQLLLRPELPADSDDEDGQAAIGSEAATAVITIDLATQLRRIEQKKKNKARCELTYTTEAVGQSSDELMAPSAKICQKWVEQVLEAQQSAYRRASARQREEAARARAPSVFPLPRTIGNAIVSCERDTSEPSVLNEYLADPQAAEPTLREDSSRDALVDERPSSGDDKQPRLNDCGSQTGAATSTAKMMESAVSNSSMSSSGVSFTLSPSATRQMDEDRRQRCQRNNRIKSSKPPLRASTTISSSKMEAHKRVALSASTLSSSSSSSESESSFLEASYSTRFLPSRVKSCRFKSRRHEGESESYPYISDNNEQDRSDDDDDDLSQLSPRSRDRVAAALRRQRLRLQQRQLERGRETTSCQSPLHRYLDPPGRQEHSSRRQRGSFTIPLPLRSSSMGSSRVDSLDEICMSSNARDGEMRHINQHDDLDRRRQRAQSDEASSRQELLMLQRVEGALRHLEHENAQRKQHEEALAAQVQALKDALRVKSAEREHVACEFRAVLHDKEKWQQAAQNAERMASQLREELTIAREEAQLLARDKLRLKRQNGELLAQVHRLDSLVYGRF